MNITANQWTATVSKPCLIGLAEPIEIPNDVLEVTDQAGKIDLSKDGKKSTAVLIEVVNFVCYNWIANFHDLQYLEKLNEEE